jgi:glycosyltransferase involved in cell wall biosynthesis
MKAKHTAPGASMPFILDDPFADERLSASGIATPLVSIILTNYNYGRYVEACLDSVERQSYRNFECLIVDDVSTDDSPARIKAFIARAKEPEKFTLIERTENGGQMEGFRTGLAHCKGTFVVLLDADDVLLPDFLETHLTAHLGVKTVAFTSTNQYQIDGQGVLTGGDHLDHQGKGQFRFAPDHTFHRGYWIWATASSMMFRKTVLDLIFPDPDVTFRICADYFVAHFAQLLGNSLLIPTIHGCYRRHGENNFGSNPIIGALNSVGSMDKHPPHDDFRKAMIAHVLRHFDRFHVILGPRVFALLMFRLNRLGELLRLYDAHPDKFRSPKRVLVRRYLAYRVQKYFIENRPWPQKLKLIKTPQPATSPHASPAKVRPE